MEGAPTFYSIWRWDMDWYDERKCKLETLFFSQYNQCHLIYRYLHFFKREMDHKWGRKWINTNINGQMRLDTTLAEMVKDGRNGGRAELVLPQELYLHN